MGPIMAMRISSVSREKHSARNKGKEEFHHLPQKQQDKEQRGQIANNR